MRMKKFFYLMVLLLTALLYGCPDSDHSGLQPDIEQQVEKQLSSLTLKQKVCQMFFVRPEAMYSDVEEVDLDRMAEVKLGRLDNRMRMFSEEYPVGGICLFAHNILNPQQLEAFTSELHSLPLRPLLCVDEEGGRVARIANNEVFGLERFESMGAIGSTNDPRKAYDAARYIGSYVHHYGFDIDFAPVADVNTNPENVIIGTRAFSDNPDVAASMVTSYLDGLWDAGIYGCVKHFPGHGDVKGDTHTGYVATQKSWDELLKCEMITFRTAIEHGVRLIMTAHIAAPCITGNDLPATMSSTILTGKLRGELGYNGLIITDAMEMGAICQHYSSSESAVGTIKAGADIVLLPKNLREAVGAVIRAVESGEIPESQINDSVRRILAMKASRFK